MESYTYSYPSRDNTTDIEEPDGIDITGSPVQMIRSPDRSVTGNDAPAHSDHHEEEIESLCTKDVEAITSPVIRFDKLSLESKETADGGVDCTRSDPHSRINMLFPEIMSEIFMHCIPKGIFNPAYTFEAPFLLLRICRYWRDIAISTPRLWCSLDVSICSSFSSSNRQVDLRVAHTLRTWLDRSKDCPLSLSLRTLIPKIPECMSVMVKHMSRCAKLRIILYYEAFSALKDVTIPLPLLEDLSIENRSTSSIKVRIKTFACAPRLRRVVLLNPGVLFQTIDIPWRQLQDLELCIDGRSIARCWEVLRQCKNLTVLDINIIRGRSEDFNAWLSVQQDITEFPNLRTLKIDAQTDCYLDRFLGYWLVPNLRSLNVRDGFRLEAVMDLLSRSGTELREFKLFSRNFFKEPEDVLMFLQSLPSLVVLVVDYRGSTNSFIELLTYRPSQNGGDALCLLPKLRVLSLDVQDMEEELVKDMLASRYALEYSKGDDAPIHAIARLEEAKIEIQSRSPPLQKRWFINHDGNLESLKYYELMRQPLSEPRVCYNLNDLVYG